MSRHFLFPAMILATGSSLVQAGGFALNEQSISAAGTANAGRAAQALDASVVFNNPGAMMQLKQAEFSSALAFIDARSRLTEVSAPLGGTTEGNIVPHTFVPSAFFSSGDRGGWAWGVAAYGSFGLKTNYEPTFAGGTYGDKSSVKVTTLQPALSYQLNEHLSVGIGPTLNKLEAYLSRASPLPGGEAIYLEGEELGYGYNIGLHAQLGEATQAGLVYRSQVKYNIKGEIHNFPMLGVPSPLTARTRLTTPDAVELALTHALTNKTLLHAGAVWTRWSTLQSLEVTTAAPFDGVGAAASESFDWENTWGTALGISHQASDRLTLRAGLAYDRSPVTEEHLSVRLPSGNRRIATVGLGWQLSPSQRLDFSYAYLDESRRRVEKAGDLMQGQPPFAATYKNTASIYGLQFNQRF